MKKVFLYTLLTIFCAGAVNAFPGDVAFPQVNGLDGKIAGGWLPGWFFARRRSGFPTERSQFPHKKRPPQGPKTNGN